MKYIHFTLYFAICCIAILLLHSCANIVAIEGGAKDTTAPQADSSASSPFKALNFKGKKLQFRFNEWVELNNPAQQIIISPPLKQKPEVTLRGKTVTIKWSDTLRENTTYTVSFGEAIRDITERNPNKNLRYVFSTGNFLDSMRTSGTLTNALTGKAEKDVLVMLYSNTISNSTNDSVVRKRQPDYFAITDESGDFKIENLKQAKYKVFALRDGNYNYKYDQENENIAFMNENIDISASPILKLQLFEAEKKYKIIQSRSREYGKVVVSYNRKPEGVNVQNLTNGTVYNTTIDNDSLVIWHEEAGKNTAFLVTYPDKSTDTVRLKLPTAAEWLGDKPILLLQQANDGLGRKGRSDNAPKVVKTRTQRINIDKKIANTSNFDVTFARPITQLDTSKIVLRDSLQRRVAIQEFRKKTSGFNTELNIKPAAWQDGMRYTLTLLPQAVNSNGLDNDTIVYTKITPLGKKELGTIAVKLKGLDSQKQYVLEVFQQGATLPLLTEYLDKPAAATTLTYKNQLPNSYSLKLIEDTNGNRRWDSGNYYEHRQPEKILTTEPQVLRPNWEMEMTLDVSPSVIAKDGKK